MKPAYRTLLTERLSSWSIPTLTSSSRLARSDGARAYTCRREDREASARKGHAARRGAQASVMLGVAHPITARVIHRDRRPNRPTIQIESCHVSFRRKADPMAGSDGAECQKETSKRVKAPSRWRDRPLRGRRARRECRLS